MAKPVRNFGHNVSFTPAAWSEPRSEEELLELLKRYRDQPIRVVASRHAWSDAIKTHGLLVSLQHLNHVRINKGRGTVSIGQGVRSRHCCRS